ncbi:hypothetical protein CRUP_010979 [Coryphaenoides rupestris]|nr:hypothetical protein CRUP_010979 [Coryphaenoides rupestris]
MQASVQDLPKPVRANFILNVETDELFITAGLQDRVVQVYEGLVYMDFSKQLMEERGYGDYIPMDMSCLPVFWLAFLSDPSDSGRIHGDFGSAVKLPGSGGAVVGLCLDQQRMVEMRQAFQEAGCVFCVIVPHNPSASNHDVPRVP